MKRFIALLFLLVSTFAQAADLGAIRPGATYAYTAMGIAQSSSVDTIELDVVGGWTYNLALYGQHTCCLLYTSPSPRDGATSRMPSSA